MSDIVREWYEDAENIDEMLDWNKRKLKKWEKKSSPCCLRERRSSMWAAVWGERLLL